MRFRAIAALVSAIATVSTLAVALVVTSPAAAAAPSLNWQHTYASLNRSSSPGVADVAGDSTPEIVLGGQDGYVRVLDPNTGNNIPNWPQPALVQGNGPVAVDSSPAVGDLDNNGSKEVVVGAGSTDIVNQQGGVVVYESNGAIRCSFRTQDAGNIWANTAGPDGYSDAVYSTPALGDINGDNLLDIVFGAFDLNVWALDLNCNPLPGFPYHVEDSTWSSPALYDNDGDGRLEIFIGSDQSPGGNIDFAGGEFRALDWSALGVREQWKVQIGDVFHSSPAIGDINGDGRVEVVTGAGNYYNNVQGRYVYAFHIEDGSTVPGWPKGTNGPTRASPALADITGDGVVDVIEPSEDGSIYAWRGDGSTIWQVPPIGNCCIPPGPINASPITADVSGDGIQDVIVGNNWATYVINGPTGSVLYGPLSGENSGVGGWSYQTAAAVGDFGGLGRRLITVGFSPPQNQTHIASYSIGSTGSLDWPMFRKNARRLGANLSGGNPIGPAFCSRGSNPAATPSNSSASGYWFVGIDGGIFSFGTAAFYGSMGGQRLNAPVIQVHATKSGNGYWLLGSDGGIFSFGDAAFYGSTGGIPLNAPIVGMAPTPSGNGYWLVGSDGGVFSFGDAAFHGSTGGLRLNAPVIAMAADPSTGGYWLLASDGGVFSFGGAQFHGSTGGLRLNAPVISMSSTRQGGGYWLLASDGGVFSFDVPFYGSIPGTGLCIGPTARQIRATNTGGGYYLLGTDGGVFSFGDAKFLGSFPGLGPNNFAIDLTIKP